jgi:molybdopterin-binding protein
MPSIQNPALTIVNLLVKRGNKFTLSINNLNVRQGEILAIIGPNGAGKSTLFLAISKLIETDAGSILFSGTSIEELDSLEYRRQIALVLQEPLLLDTSVYNNIATGLNFRGISKSKQNDLITEWMSRLNINHLKDHPASQLSGGQAQRVSLARALILSPTILLLDEPFRALDAPSRTSLMQDLRGLLSEIGTTTIFITHDQVQALYLGDRVAVLLDGKLRQVGYPQSVFSSPIDRDVADFLGVENVLPGKVVKCKKGKLTVLVNEQKMDAIGSMDLDKDILLCLRPEDITLWKAPEKHLTSARNHLTGYVKSIQPHGPLMHIILDCGFPLVVLITRASAQELEINEGMQLSASFKASAVHLIPR